MRFDDEYSQKYEYAFEVVLDKNGGVDLHAVNAITRDKSKEGWRLITVFTNELGKNAISVAGIGVNSSVDETILVFEREAKQKSKDLHYTEVPIIESNIIYPFVPKTASFFKKNGVFYVAVKVFCGGGFELKGLQGDLIIRNLFGDEITVEDVCFISFEKNHDGYLVSSPFPVELPDKISCGISNSSLSVKRYIVNDKLEILQDTAVLSIAEAQAAKAGSFNLGAFLLEVESANNAAGIYTCVQLACETNPNIFNEDILQEIERLKLMERSYGNMKQSALKSLRVYFDNMGLE